MSKEKIENYESYLDKGFNEEQLYEIKKGIEEGNDVSVYARVKMPASEMAHIRKTQNFKKSLNQIVEENKNQNEKENKEIIQDIRTRHERIADLGILIGETSIVVAIISLLLVMLGIY